MHLTATILNVKDLVVSTSLEKKGHGDQRGYQLVLTLIH